MKFLFIIIALTVIAIGLFLYFNGYSGIEKNFKVKANQIKIACVGDSITYGYGISNWPENNYPRLLEVLLGEYYNVTNFGVNGCCVGKDGDHPYITTKAYVDSIKFDADILIFMLGSNDSKPQNWTNEKKFKEEYVNLLKTYLKEKELKVYLCTISKAFFSKGRDSGLTNYNIQPKVIEKIVEIIKEVADEKGYRLIDINKLTSDNPSWFKKDYVHPNNEGIAAIAKEIYKQMEK